MKKKKNQATPGVKREVKISVNGEIKLVGEMEEDRILLEKFDNYTGVESDGILVKDSFFDEKMKVPNVCRYLLERKDDIFALTSHDFLSNNSSSSFLLDSSHCDMLIEKNDAKKYIILVVESPHRYEYKSDGKFIFPIAPAQGTTGRLIGEKLASIINSNEMLRNSLKNDVYLVLLVNPVPFQTSLFALHGKSLKNGYKQLRDNVWSELWRNGILKEEFIKLVKETKPELILNCCTMSLSDLVSLELIKTGAFFYILDHPSRWFRKLEEIEVKQFIGNEDN